MKRMHTLWCELHPDKAHYTPQHLRDQAAALRGRGFHQTLPQNIDLDTDTVEETENPNPESNNRELDELFHRRLGEFTHQRRKRSIHFKNRVEPKALKQINQVIKTYLPADADLWTVNCAVYTAARILLPGKRQQSDYVVKLKQRLKKIEAKLLMWRKQASQIETLLLYMRERRPFTKKVTAISRTLKARHHTLNKGILILLKEQALDKLRSLKVVRGKISDQIKRSEQNSMFETAPGKVFQERTKQESAPERAAVESFWRQLYETKKEVNLAGPALELFSKMCDRTFRDVDQHHAITEKEIKTVLAKMKNYAAPGPDAINGFWWKRLSVVHEHLAREFNRFIRDPDSIPDWIAEGRTVLIYKKGDSTKPENYRPITCLNTVYKVLTSILHSRILQRIEPIWNEIYEQRGTKKGIAGVRENLIIDRAVCQDATYYKRNLSMAWVDYRKAFDCTSHDLILTLLNQMKVDRSVVGLLAGLIRVWRTRVVVRNGKKEEMSELITYQRGVFQGDSLSPLLFCLSMLPLSLLLRRSNGYNAGPPNNRKHKITHLFYMDDLKMYGQSENEIQKMLKMVQQYSSEVGMEFGIDKCAYYNILRGRGRGAEEEMTLVDGISIRHLKTGESYTYLGTPQNSMHCEEDLKTEITKKYTKMLQKIWSSELYGKNKTIATNTMAMPLVTQTFGTIYWKKPELQKLDRATRKIMHKNLSLHPNASVARLYIPRDRGGRGLVALEDMYKRIMISTATRIHHSKDPLLKLVASHEIKGNGAFIFKAAETSARDLGMTLKLGARATGELLELTPEKQRKALKLKTIENQVKTHTDKPMHGLYFKNSQEQDLHVGSTFAFLKSSRLRSETEGYITAVQDGVFHSLRYRAVILKLPTVSTRCRACKKDEETTMHLLSACTKYLPTLYISRHDAALKVLYFALRHGYGIDQDKKPHYAQSDIPAVVSNDKCRILWNFPFSTTKQLAANRPDMVLLDHEDKTMWVFEMSCPAENNIKHKEEEKITKYQPLMFELRKTYRQYDLRFIPLIIGVMGGIHSNLPDHLRRLRLLHNTNWIVMEMQKAVILGTLYILRSHEAGYPKT